MRRPLSNGFTLVEMISVLAIMAIVLSIALPAVTNLNKANVMSAAAREVSSTLSLARQYAITHRITTRVVFPYLKTLSANGLSYAPKYLSYAVISIDAAGTVTYLTKWESLPTGVVFLDKLVLNSGSLDNLNTTVLTPPKLPFPSTNPPITQDDLAYIEFDATGRNTRQGILPDTLTIRAGFIASGVPQSTPGPTPPNYRTIFVDNIVGHIQVTAP